MTDKTRILNSKIYYTCIWLIVLLLIMSGIYLSQIQFLATEWLSRAGCSIVILGIFSGFAEIVQERFISARLKLQRRNTIVAAKARLGEMDKEDTAIKIEIEEINHRFDQRLDELRQKMKMKVGVLEVVLLITGTFLWGFGDLLV